MIAFLFFEFNTTERGKFRHVIFNIYFFYLKNEG